MGKTQARGAWACVARRRARPRLPLGYGRPYAVMCTLVLMTSQPDSAANRSMRERMLAGDLYIFDDPDLAEEMAVAHDVMAAFNANTFRQGPLQRALLERLLGAIGAGTGLRPALFVGYGAPLRRAPRRCMSTTAHRSGSGRVASPTSGWSRSTWLRSSSATMCRSVRT